jgi:uncharacterized protein (TIGR02246 family)
LVAAPAAAFSNNPSWTDAVASLALTDVAFWRSREGIPMPMRCLRRRDFVAALASTAAWPLAARAQQPAIDARSIVDRWLTAFNSNDVDALVGLYAPDAILLGSTGLTLQEGTLAIRGYFARLANSGDKVVIGDRKIIVLDDNVSYATGFYEFSAVRNGEVKKSWAGFSMVLVKHANDWLIANHHSSERSSPPCGVPLQRI